jgi:hypothetical protein
MPVANSHRPANIRVEHRSSSPFASTGADAITTINAINVFMDFLSKWVSPPH